MDECGASDAGVADRVDAAVDTVEPAAPKPLVDPVPREPQRKQLST